jgi:7-carboxy-7-deazaguanine synthase (Cx14CxxC type)
MAYTVKEIFYTLQGEGFHTGRPAVFCRFSGCNLWSGREEDRNSALCRFCDTDFVGTNIDGGKFNTAKDLAEKIASFWRNKEPSSKLKPFVVCTGGEPLLQIDDPLVEALHGHGFEIAVETNGTQNAPDGIDWICVSPKSNVPIKLTHGHELKLVYPQYENHPNDFIHLNFQHFYLQPKDELNNTKNLQMCIDYCLEHPQWKLSLQTHKLTGIR